MEQNALITGASTGIGRELAIIHASRGGNMVLAARSAEKLQALSQELMSHYNVQVHVVSVDLSKPGGARELFSHVKALNVRVDLLINNAGVGEFGLFDEAGWDNLEAMVQLNISALTELTWLVLQDMKSRKSGRILNVASTAAFQPGPLMAVYFASKAYVLHLSEALANELKPYGITVTALCPGATQSEFFARAKMLDSGLVKGRRLPSSAEVAKYGYKAMMNGKTVAVHGLLNRIMAAAAGFVPRKLAVNIARRIQEKR